jgi:DNA-binding CsgD family transcriptional regulator
MIPEFRCGNVEELFQHADAFTQSLGFSHFGFVAEMRVNSQGGWPDLRTLNNCPPRWLETIESAIGEGRPHNLIRHASLHLPALGWSASGHLVGHTIVDELAWEHVRAMGGWGVQAGTLCPVAAPEIDWGAMVFFAPKPLGYEELQDVLPRCHAYASHFSFWYLQVAYRRTVGRRPQLTRREAECLNWAGQGKTSSEIGAILGISDRTVEGYIVSACDKLNARGRQAAITKAMDLQLIGGRNSLLQEFARQRDAALAPAPSQGQDP